MGVGLWGWRYLNFGFDEATLEAPHWDDSYRQMESYVFLLSPIHYRPTNLDEKTINYGTDINKASYVIAMDISFKPWCLLQRSSMR